MFTNNSEIKRIIEVPPFEIQFRFIESYESEIVPDGGFTMLYNDDAAMLTVRYPELLDEIVDIMKKRINDGLKIEVWLCDNHYLGNLVIKKFMVLDNCIMMRCTTPKYGPMEDWIYEGTPKKIEYNRYGISTDSETLLSIYY